MPMKKAYGTGITEKPGVSSLATPFSRFRVPPAVQPAPARIRIFISQPGLSFFR
jgi:hypothetical protein